MSSMRVDLVRSLEERYPERKVILSVTEEGWALLGRLGPEWLGTVVDALLLADGTARLELVLAQGESEPLPAGGWVQPGTAGGMYLDSRAVGRLSIVPNDDRAPVTKRVVSMPSARMLDGVTSVAFGAGRGRAGQRVGRAYGVLYDRAPVLLDVWKQTRNSKSSAEARAARPRVGELVGGAQRERSSDHVPTAWFALHWLEPGGAEVWALEAATVARDLGYRVVITTDVAAPQRWLARALEITPHVYLPSNVLAEEDWGAFLRGVLRRFQPEFLHIHHSSRAYAFMPELRHLAADVLVLDSTHIVEHRTGGFVRQSIEYSKLIDHHHVISPELRDLYLLDAGVERERVHYHPLTGARVSGIGRVRTKRPVGAALRVGFLGRISAQKRPFLFVEVAARLRRLAPDGFRFIIQGSGPLDELLARQLRRSGVEGVVERRSWGPAEDFLADVDVLVITSDNEGLTLTSLEADSHGVLVVSADVGSQATVVPRQLLLPRAPLAFCRGAVKLLGTLAADPEAFQVALEEQHALVDALRRVPSASDFLRPLLQDHLESVR